MREKGLKGTDNISSQWRRDVLPHDGEAINKSNLHVSQLTGSSESHHQGLKLSF